jgi:hypothetical protein
VGAQYSDDTARLLASELLAGADESSTVAVVSAPSVFIAAKNLLAEEAQRVSDGAKGMPNLLLLEHDTRFAVFPEFVYYDFQQPLKLPCMVPVFPLSVHLWTDTMDPDGRFETFR